MLHLHRRIECYVNRNSPRTEKVRVLLITPDYPPAHGGIQRLLYRITNSMPNADVRVLTPSQKDAGLDPAEGNLVTRVRVPFHQPILRNSAFNALGLLELGKWHPDVILNGHVVTSFLAVAAARKFRVPLVMYVYGKEVVGRSRTAAWGLRRSSACVAVSQFTRKQLLDASNGRHDAAIYVVHPGVDLPLRQEDRQKASRPTLLTIGRLRDSYKGHDVVLEAMPEVLRQVPNAQWIVVGEGKLRQSLKREAIDRGLGDAVHFVGAVDDSEKDRWLAQSHVFVMPARYPPDEIAGEGFPVVYLEAAAWSLPAVAGKDGGPAEAVMDGVTGILVDPRSPQEVAAAVTRLLLDTSLAERLGTQAAMRAKSSFTWNDVGGELEAVLRSVTRGTR